MKKGIIIFLIFLILVGGTLFYLHKTFDKKNQSDFNSYSALTIRAFENNKQISTGYAIYANGGFYKQGKTLINGYIKENIPINTTIFVTNKNINNQSYYTYNTSFISSKPLNRVKINLIKPAKIQVTPLVNTSNSSLNLKLKSPGEYRNIMFCIKWGNSFVDVRSDYNLIETPIQYKNYFKCYNTGQSLNNNEVSINIHYKIWSNLLKSDFIEVVLNDQDYQDNKLMLYNNSKDLFGKEKIVRLNQTFFY